ncbi:MAG: ABC-2 family transporter protein [Candidatus Chisholmbacteria bacterium]|nr:ABC-2 family transporter protein [Candidatus Chisholmbacteria bacterium]
MLRKYFIVWLKSASLSTQSNLTQRFGAILFITGKLIRFGFFLVLLIVIGDRVSSTTGYSLNQMIIFFLLFNLLDMFGQIFFRGIYWFRQQVVTGEFDFRLTKPMSALFQALTRQTDILDLPLFILIIIYLAKNAAAFAPIPWGLFVALTLAGLVVITAVHIAVAALGVLTTEVDHTMMIYRDLSAMARVPIDIYGSSIRTFLTFIIPIGIAYTIPAKAFLGLVSIQTALISIAIAIASFFLSLILWRFALTKYSSASS